VAVRPQVSQGFLPGTLEGGGDGVRNSNTGGNGRSYRLAALLRGGYAAAWPAAKGKSVPARSRLGPVAIGLVLVATVVVVFQYALLGPARHLGLVPEAQRFTELAFVTPSQLPSSAVPGVPLHLAFSITNREGQSRTYRWSAILREGTSQATLAGGEVLVKASHTTEVPFAIALKGPLRAPAEISVSLASPQEAIFVHVSP
jgi:hypothetical protein